MSKIPNNKINNSFKKNTFLKEQSIIKKPFIEKDKVQKMSQERILQKNVVYVIGLSYKLANKEILQKNEYFGQYGNILKILTNKTKGLAQNSYYENCYSSYIYFSSPVEAAIAILAVDNFKIENHYLKTSFGRTKYCSYFLRNLECLNKDCFYLHKLADKDEIITGDDSKMLFHDQHIQALRMANLLDSNFKKKILADEAKKNFESIFPKISAIYTKPVFFEFVNEINSSSSNNAIANSNGLFSVNSTNGNNNNNNNNNAKVSLNSIVNGNKDKYSINNSNINNTNNNKKNISVSNKENIANNNNISTVEENSCENDEFCSNSDINIANNQAEYISSEGNETVKIKDPLQGLKLADILRNDKKAKQNSPQKVKLTDIVNNRSLNNKKQFLIIKKENNQKNPIKNILAENNKNSASFTNNKLNENNLLKSKGNLPSKDTTDSKKPESLKIINKSFEEEIKFSKGKLSEASNYSNETNKDRVYYENFNSNKSAASVSYNNSTNNYENEFSKNAEFDIELNNSSKSNNNIKNEGCKTDNFDIAKNEIVNKKVLQNVNINSNCNNSNNVNNLNICNKEENKDLFKNLVEANGKNSSIVTLPQKISFNGLGGLVQKTKQQIISEVNNFYLDTFEKNEFLSNKNSNSSNNTNSESYHLRKIKIVNNKEKKENKDNNENNKKMAYNDKDLNNTLNNNVSDNNYFIDSTKSNPRSSIPSSTSCSVSPNISYNQEIDKDINNQINNLSNLNKEINNNNNKTTDIPDKKKSIYTKRDISRFDFVLNNSNNNINNNSNKEKSLSAEKRTDNYENSKVDDEIPEFVFDVLNKKISRFSFFKRFKNEYEISDSIFLEDRKIDKNKDESWANFIKMNLYS